MSYIITNVSITYQNGANVSTGFITNLEPTPCFKSESNLKNLLTEANKENLKKITKQLPRYKYPKNILTVSKLSYLAKNGVSLCIDRNKCKFVRRLDDQIKHKKTIFGCGYIISDEIADVIEIASKQAAAQAAA